MKGQYMRVGLGKYNCEGNAGSFEAPLLGDFASLGNVAYMNTFQCPAFSEVAELLHNELREDDLGLPDLLHAIFGRMACDPDPFGAPYEIGVMPPCPESANRRVVSWELIYPPKIVDWEIPTVTHDKWNRLSTPEKVDTVKRFVAEQLAR